MAKQCRSNDERFARGNTKFLRTRDEEHDDGDQQNDAAAASSAPATSSGSQESEQATSTGADLMENSSKQKGKQQSDVTKMFRHCQPTSCQSMTVEQSQDKLYNK